MSCSYVILNSCHKMVDHCSSDVPALEYRVANLAIRGDGTIIVIQRAPENVVHHRQVAANYVRC